MPFTAVRDISLSSVPKRGGIARRKIPYVLLN